MSERGIAQQQPHQGEREREGRITTKSVSYYVLKRYLLLSVAAATVVAAVVSVVSDFGVCHVLARSLSLSLSKTAAAATPFRILPRSKTTKSDLVVVPGRARFTGNIHFTQKRGLQLPLEGGDCCRIALSPLEIPGKVGTYT